MAPHITTPTVPPPDAKPPPNNNIITLTGGNVPRTLYPNAPAPSIPSLPIPPYLIGTTDLPMEDWGPLLDNSSSDDEAPQTYDD